MDDEEIRAWARKRVEGSLLRASATDREAMFYAIGFNVALWAMGIGSDNDAVFVINDRIAKGDSILHRGMMETGKTLRASGIEEEG
jgi:hypothetical protein